MVFREKEASQGMDANFALMNHACEALNTVIWLQELATRDIMAFTHVFLYVCVCV